MLQRSTIVLLCVLMLSACAPILSAREARATAVASGCWPYGVDQPETPMPAPTVGGGTPTPDAVPTVVNYPACTPQPGTPTATVRPTRVPTPSPMLTPPPASLRGGPAEIAQQPGFATPWRLAPHPTDDRAALAWVQWGGDLSDEYLGDVWVRVQGPGGRWGLAQTLNVQPVRKDYGGVGIAYTPDGVLHVVFGAGGAGSDTGLYHRVSRDDGATWEVATRLAFDGGVTEEGGGVLDLKSDNVGSLYLLLLTGSSPQLAYAELPSGATAWIGGRPLVGGRQITGALALLIRADGSPRRFIIAPDADSGTMQVIWSDNGRQWQRRPIPTGRFIPENIRGVVAWAGWGPDGAAIIAAAWGQYAQGGVFAAISRDGGERFGLEERIAQYTDDGAFVGPDQIPIGGFSPGLAYDAGSATLVATWEEARRVPEPDGTPRIERRIRMATRPVDVPTWQFDVAPGDDLVQIVVSDWGVRGLLTGDSTGLRHWLTLLDTRNTQQRLLVEPITPAALVGEAS